MFCMHALNMCYIVDGLGKTFADESADLRPETCLKLMLMSMTLRYIDYIKSIDRPMGSAIFDIMSK